MVKLWDNLAQTDMITSNGIVTVGHHHIDFGRLVGVLGEWLDNFHKSFANQILSFRLPIRNIIIGVSANLKIVQCYHLLRWALNSFK